MYSGEARVLSDNEVLKSVKAGKPPADGPVIGTWKLPSYVRERLSDRHCHNQFGGDPDGYIEARHRSARHTVAIIASNIPEMRRPSRPSPR